MDSIEFLEELFKKVVKNSEIGIIGIMNESRIRLLDLSNEELVLYYDTFGIVLATDSDFEVLKANRLRDEMEKGLPYGSTVPIVLQTINDEFEASSIIEIANSKDTNYEEKLMNLISVLKEQKSYELIKSRR